MLAFSAGDLAFVALSFFLVLVALGIAWVCWRLGETLERLSAFLQGAREEVLPVVSKAGTTIDHTNAQMEKVDRMTDSAVDAVEAADVAVRAVSMVVTTPVRKVSGFAAGISHGVADFKVNRNLARARSAASAAAAEREAELDQELRKAGGPEWPTS